uniref:RRM domain-containing protein n=1 Tax=Fagus sylvatica TaxID=28930 RepID=A0A2N9EGZ9_FAGSY
MARYRSRSRSYSPRRRSRTPPRGRKRYEEEPRDRYHDSKSYRDRRSPAPSGLLVRNLPLDARPEDLRAPFERFGQVKDVYLPKNYYSGGCSRNFPWKGIWKTCISPRVAFFAWMSALGKILIMDNLWKRAILIVDWRCMLGISWVMPLSVAALLESWRGFMGMRWGKEVWGAAPACSIWFSDLVVLESWRGVMGMRWSKEVWGAAPACSIWEPRGFGFVKYRYAEDAAEAKQQLNHTIIGGREIRIVFAEENRKTPQEMRTTTRLTQGLQHQLGVTQGTMWLGMIIVLQCDLGQFRDLLLHAMRGTTGGPLLQGKTVLVPIMIGIMHQVGL